MKFFNDLNGFLVNESMKQARNFLDSKGIDYTLEGSEEKEIFDNISKDLNKMPNLIANFIKYHFEEKIAYIDTENIDDSVFADIKGTIDYIIKNKGRIKNMLKKNIIDYDRFEYLTDDLRDAEMKQTVKKEFVDKILINKVNIHEVPNDRSTPIIETITGNYRKNFDFSNFKMTSIANMFIKEFEKHIQTKEFERYIKSNNLNIKNDSIPAFMNMYGIIPIHRAMKDGYSLIKYMMGIETSIEKYNSSSRDNNNSALYKAEALKKEIRQLYDEESTTLVYEKDGVLVYRTFRKTFIVNYGGENWCIVTNPENNYDDYCSPISGYTQYIIFNFNYKDSDIESRWGVTVLEDGSTSKGRQDRRNVMHPMSTIQSVNGIPHGILIPHKYNPRIITKFQSLDDRIRRIKDMESEDKLLDAMDDDMDIIEMIGTGLDFTLECFKKRFWRVLLLLLKTGTDPNIRVQSLDTSKHSYLLHEVIYHMNSAIFKPSAGSNHYNIDENMRLELQNVILKSPRLDIDKRDEFMGRTVLHYAVKSGSKDLIKTLLDKGANPNAASGKKNPPTGNGPLGISKDIEISKMLLDAGADPLKDNEYGSAMDTAKMYKKQHLIDLYNKYI